MIEGINKLLELNDIMVKIYNKWYKLDEVFIVDGKMPIFVSDEDGGEHEFDMADIDEFDPIFATFGNMENTNVGIS